MKRKRPVSKNRQYDPKIMLEILLHPDIVAEFVDSPPEEINLMIDLILKTGLYDVYLSRRNKAIKKNIEEREKFMKANLIRKGCE